jgi:hypothetical protein
MTINKPKKINIEKKVKKPDPGPTKLAHKICDLIVTPA